MPFERGTNPYGIGVVASGKDYPVDIGSLECARGAAAGDTHLLRELNPVEGECIRYARHGSRLSVRNGIHPSGESPAEAAILTKGKVSGPVGSDSCNDNP